MTFTLSQIGQIALAVSDVDRAEAFYGDVLGLKKLFRFGDLTFFDCAGVRLLLEKAHGDIHPARARSTSAAPTSGLRSPNLRSAAFVFRQSRI